MISTFRQHVIENLAKPNVRANFRKAMDGLMQRRLDQFPDPEELERIRTQAQAIRANALSKLPRTAGATGSQSHRQRHPGPLG